MSKAEIFFSRLLVVLSLSLAHGLRAQKVVDCYLPPELAPKYDPAKMEANYERFIDSLKAFKIMADYPGAVRKLLSSDKEKQLAGMKLLADSHEPEIMPWLVSFLHSEDDDLQRAAYAAMEELITYHALKRRDPEIGQKIVILPPGPDDFNLQALAWPIFQALNRPDLYPSSVLSTAAFSAGYLLLEDFEPLLKRLLNNEHPANQHAAKTALEIIENSRKQQTN